MSSEKFDQWAILELMGHQRLAGRVSEETIGGSAFVRIDVPESEGRGAFTKYYGSGAIYCITPCTEETARAAAGSFQKAPANAFDMRDWVEPRQLGLREDYEDYED